MAREKLKTNQSSNYLDPFVAPARIEPAKIVQYFNDTAPKVFAILNTSTSAATFSECIPHLNALVGRFREAKIAAHRSDYTDDLANELLGYQCATAALYHEARMWLELQRQRPHEAWREFVDAEEHVNVAARTDLHHVIQQIYGGRFERLQSTLFPPMVFLSAGFTHDEGKCSICNQQVSTCAHIGGRIYRGQVCAEYGFNEFRGNHIAVVKIPLDKRCYVARYNGGSGWIDKLTGKPVRPLSKKADEPLKNGVFLYEGTGLTLTLPPGSFL